MIVQIIGIIMETSFLLEPQSRYIGGEWIIRTLAMTVFRVMQVMLKKTLVGVWTNQGLVLVTLSSKSGPGFFCPDYAVRSADFDLSVSDVP